MIAGIIILILFTIIPIAVIVLIINAIVRHTRINRNEKEEDSNFEKMIRLIYVYFLLVCLLCSMIGGTIYLFSSAMDYFLPEETTSSYSSNYNYVERERNVAIVGMFTGSSMLVSTVPLFIYHSKISKSESGNRKKS